MVLICNQYIKSRRLSENAKMEKAKGKQCPLHETRQKKYNKEDQTARRKESTQPANKRAYSIFHIDGPYHWSKKYTRRPEVQSRKHELTNPSFFKVSPCHESLHASSLLEIISTLVPCSSLTMPWVLLSLSGTIKCRENPPYKWNLGLKNKINDKWRSVWIRA